MKVRILRKLCCIVPPLPLTGANIKVGTYNIYTADPQGVLSQNYLTTYSEDEVTFTETEGGFTYGGGFVRDFNAACNIKEFGLKALPTERGKVKPVDCPLVDDRPRVLKAMAGRSRKREEVLVSPKPLNL